MSEVTDVWLLAVALDGEESFWVCEPTNLRPLAEDWKAANCRWLYPVVDNVSRFADLSGFDSTDSVYEVEWIGVSKVHRAATLLWNVKAKRQKVDGITYVFVPAGEIKVMDDAYRKFLKLEATKPRAVPAAPLSSSSQLAGPEEGEKQEGDAEVAIKPPRPALTSTKTDDDADAVEEAPEHTPAEAVVKREEEADEAEGSQDQPHSQPQQTTQQSAAEDDDGDVTFVSTFAAPRRPTASSHRSSSSYLSFPSHKRQQPHRGTTIYQAPVHSKPTGTHRSDEAFEWEQMYVVHRGSVDYLCPHATNNSYGFRLDRVMHNSFPVFLLFSSAHNNSESIDASVHGVPVFERAKLTGEAGEGAVRNTVLVVTRLSSKKHQPYYRQNTGRKVHQRRGSDSDDETTTEEEEEYMSDDDDEDDEASDDTYEDDDDDTLLATSHDRRNRRQQTRMAPAAKRPKAESTTPTPPPRGETTPTSPTASPSAARKRGRKGAAERPDSQLQAVSVNFWTDPQQVAPAPSQLAKEFPFRSEGADVPQTVVFSDGVCVTYTAATAAKHAQQHHSEKKRGAAKHGGTASASEDADLSMLNEHILNAFAQVRKEENTE